MAITFETPKSPSSQLKTVLRYFEFIKALDLVELDTLFADGFVQSTRPLSLGVPSRTKAEDLAFLGALAEKLKGRHVEVTFQPPPGGPFLYHRWEKNGMADGVHTIACVTQVTMYDVIESPGKAWAHVRTLPHLLPNPSMCVCALAHNWRPP